MNLKFHIKNIIKAFFLKFGARISAYESDISKAQKHKFEKWETLSQILTININRRSNSLDNNLENHFIDYILSNYKFSQSQIFQDMLVLFLTRNKANGFFVEFGATNGVSFSNTYSLEKLHSWHGILAEPALTWRNDLYKNRGCSIDSRCVWSKSAELLDFNQTEISELSTIELFSQSDNLRHSRRNWKSYQVETVSLNDLLDQHNAPAHIDFISIDTEGSEFQILNAFDFSKYRIDIFCIEHNYNDTERNNIYELMNSKGFTRIFSEYSLFDDWYVSPSIMADSNKSN